MDAKADFPFGEVQARAAMLAPAPMARTAKERGFNSERELEMNRRVDQTLEDSFPASDPPSWTASVARPAPAVRVVVRTEGAGAIRRALRRAAVLF